jgi:CubicO group peptidase (beta-lactamase class C family)
MARFFPTIVGTFFVVLALPMQAAELTLEAVQAAAEKLKAATIAEMEKEGIPGIAIAVVFKDQVVLAEGFGVREAGKEGAVDADTVFQLASVSKPIGSTVVAALVGDGMVSWDSRINDLDPAFAMSQPWVTSEITIRDFYCHRSGLPEHSGDLLEDIGYSREEVLHRLRFQKPNTSFRSGYAYTNFGMTEAAMAAAKAVGKTWEDLSQEKLYGPLGMTRTSSRYADFIAQENHAVGHLLENGKWKHKEQRMPDAQTPAGGVSSSVNDMAKWMLLQIHGGKFGGKQIVSEKALDETRRPEMLTGYSPLDGLPGFYGLGWNVRWDAQGRLRIGHSGAFSMGAATFVGIVPEEQLGVVVLTNASPLGVPEGLGGNFLDDAIYGKPGHDWLPLFKKVFAQMAEAEAGELADYTKPPASPTPARKSGDYAGVYQNDFFGPIAVVANGDHLFLELGPNKKRFPMDHWDRDTFTFQPGGENAAGRAGLFFTLGPDGRATHLVVENLNVRGEGAFGRSDTN